MELTYDEHIAPYLKEPEWPGQPHKLKMPLAIFERWVEDIEKKCPDCKGAGFPVKIINGTVRGLFKWHRQKRNGISKWESEYCKACTGSGAAT